jgi:hypothetical protein
VLIGKCAVKFRIANARFTEAANFTIGVISGGGGTLVLHVSFQLQSGTN